MIDHNLTSILKSSQQFCLIKDLSEKEKTDIYLLSNREEKKRKCVFIYHDGLNEMVNLNLLRENWLKIYLNQDESSVFYSEKERQLGIFLLLFSEELICSVNLFIKLFYVSKNTILSDIKKLKKILNLNGIEIKNTRKKGYYLYGEENKIRCFSYEVVEKLISEKQGNYLMYSLLWQIEKFYHDEIKLNLYKKLDKHKLILFPSKREYLIYFISFLSFRMKKKSFYLLVDENLAIETTYIYNFSLDLINQFDEIKDKDSETVYLSIIFLSIVQGRENDIKFGFLIACSDGIIKDVERRAAIEFNHYRQLLSSLYSHLVPTYFRVKYDLPIKNELIYEIKKQYTDLFIIVKKALLHLEVITKNKISDAEVGYITILFGAAIANQKEINDVGNYHGLIVCPSGISSSLMLKSELEQLFPLIKFDSTDSISLNQTIDLNQYDVIFSSISLNISKKVYSVYPVMSKIEKIELLQKVQRELFLDVPMYPNAEEIIKMVLPYINLKEGITQEKLNKIITKKIERKISRKDGEKPMLSELLTGEMIQLCDKKLGWEEAISLSAQPLIEKDKIEQRYIDAMINKVKEYGAFINIGRNIALPHARPEDGVKEIGMSLLKLSQPVLLLDDEKHPVTVFICLSASDNDSHLRALASLTKILSNKELFEELLSATNKEEILKIINKGE